MECLTEEGDRDSIVWRKDGEGVPSNSRIISNKQTLQIFNLQREDYGVYQCFVTRGQAEAQATAHLRLGGRPKLSLYYRKVPKNQIIKCTLNYLYSHQFRSFINNYFEAIML